MAYISNSTSNTLIVGTAENDSIYNYVNYVTIDGGAGNDLIDNSNGNANTVTIIGSDGNDTISNVGSNVAINGGTGNDVIDNGLRSGMVLIGFETEDRSNFGKAVTILGGTGDDKISLQSSVKENIVQYNLGEGHDSVWGYSDSNSLQINSSVGWSSVISGNDVVIYVGDGSITLVNAVTSSGVNINGVTYPIDTTSTIPAVVDTSTIPAVVDTSTIPAVVDTSTIPAVVDTSTVPAVVDTSTVPAVVDTSTIPAVVDTSTIPVDPTPTPTPTPVIPEILPPAISNTAYDIVFILDVSGSMSYYIDRVNQIAQTFVDKLAERGITDYRLAVVDYETAPTVYFGADGSSFTTDVNLFKAWLSQASAKSMAGLPNENGLYAINYILDTFTFNPEANKEFIVLTDEDFYDGITADLSATEQLLATNDVQLDVIGEKGTTCESAWTPVARHTGGNFYDINGNYGDTIIEIVRNFDCVNVDLSTVPDGQAGWFIVVPGYNINGNSVDAVFVNALDPNLAVYAQTLPVVGMVSADKVYNGTVSSYRQNITIPDTWNVTATSHADILNVAGTGFGVVISSGDGHDAVKLGESATGVILTDHDLSNDGLEFEKRQPLGTFTESVETNPVTLMNQVTLASPTMSIYLQNFSSPLLEEFEAKNAQFMSYGVTNKNRSDTVYDLLFSEDYVGIGDGRIIFAQWGYGFTPPEGNPLLVNPTLATSADLAANFGSPTLDEISPANFAVTANDMTDQNLTAFNPEVTETILASNESKF